MKCGGDGTPSCRTGSGPRFAKDFEAALSRAEPGEIVYLTVVSNRQCKQLQVPLYQRHD
jgi:hypothetical protein